jgi:cytochrome b subunit of formate dehydrogenase
MLTTLLSALYLGHGVQLHPCNVIAAPFPQISRCGNIFTFVTAISEIQIQCVRTYPHELLNRPDTLWLHESGKNDGQALFFIGEIT